MWVGTREFTADTHDDSLINSTLFMINILNKNIKTN